MGKLIGNVLQWGAEWIGNAIASYHVHEFPLKKFRGLMNRLCDREYKLLMISCCQNNLWEAIKKLIIVKY